MKKLLSKIKARIRLALHNILGHPLMEVAYIFGLLRFGNWIHDKLFKINH
jgi:hypothetical protein